MSRKVCDFNLCIKRRDIPWYVSTIRGCAKKLLVIISIVFGLATISHSDELDSIIDYSIANSLSGKTISNDLELNSIAHKTAWLSLMPSIKASGGMSYYNTTENIEDAMYASISISESFSDVDATIQQLRKANNSLLAGKIQHEIDKRNYIGRIILAYTTLSIYDLEQAIKLVELENNRLLLKTMNIKMRNGREIGLNVRKLSNQIIIDEGNLEIDRIEFANTMRNFLLLTGITNNDFNLQMTNVVQTDIANVDTQYELLMRLNHIRLTNNNIDLSRQKRSHFLPKLNLSLSYGYDLKDASSSYGFGVGLSFSFLEFFDRQADIHKSRIYGEKLATTISNLQIEWTNAILIMQQRATSLEKKTKLLKNDVEIERDLQRLYAFQYENDHIDFFTLKSRQHLLLSAELKLLRARRDLYVLRKRLMYGIVK